MANHNAYFLDSQEEDLNRIGLEIYDVSPARYLEIDLNIERKEPQRVYPFGRYDTITVLNPQDIAGKEVWLYINKDFLENRYPLHLMSKIETKGNEIYLQHQKINTKLKIIVGGDARAFNADPINKDYSLDLLQGINLKMETVIDNSESLKTDSAVIRSNTNQINQKQSEIIDAVEQVKNSVNNIIPKIEQGNLKLDSVDGKLNQIKDNSGNSLTELQNIKSALENLTEMFEEGFAKVQSTQQNEIKGLSILEKPVNVENLTTYLEMDTSKLFYFYEGNWIPFGEGG